MPYNSGYNQYGYPSMYSAGNQVPQQSGYPSLYYSAGNQVPQQGGGNRYIPPTFNWGTNQSTRQPDYSSMNWNNVANYNLPQQNNNPFQQQYANYQNQMLGGFDQRYPSRQPMMPQFLGGDPYQMYAGGGFGGYPGMMGGGRPGMGTGGGGLPPGYSYNSDPNRQYTMDMPSAGMRFAYGPNGDRIEVPVDGFGGMMGGLGGMAQNPFSSMYPQFGGYGGSYGFDPRMLMLQQMQQQGGMMGRGRNGPPPSGPQDSTGPTKPMMAPYIGNLPGGG